MIDIVDIAEVNECFVVGLLLDVYVMADCKLQMKRIDCRRKQISYSLPSNGRCYVPLGPSVCYANNCMEEEEAAEDVL